MADYLPPIVARLQGDDAQLTRTFNESRQRAERWARDMSRIRAEMTIVARMDAASQRRAETVRRELSRDISSRVRLDVDSEAQRRAEAQLARLSRDRTVTVRTRVIGGGNAASSAAGDVGAMSALISLAPALAPVAAYAASVAASVGAATVAVGAFGLAVAPQIKQLSAAADAQSKYTQAVQQYGAYSQQAVKAQRELAATFDAMPPATQRAAMAFAGFKDEFKSWSNGLASFTMEPVERSLAVLERILPKLSPMAQSAAGDLNRLVTVAGGAVSTPGFDSLSKRFSDFADRTLKNATDDVVHFARVLSEGGADGPIAKFMAYAKQEGPQVKQTLEDVAKATAHILQGAAEAGPGMLTLVDAVAKLVNSLPPAFIARVMQAYAAFRLFKLASVGVTAVTAALTTFGAAARRAGEAAAASSTGTQALGAAFSTLSTKAKVGVVTAALAAATVALHAFANNHDAPKIDQLTTALGKFGQNGAVTGALKDNLDDLSKSIATVANSASDNKWAAAASNVAGFLGVGSGPSIGEAKKQFDALDKSLANLYQSGHTQEAAAAYGRLEKAFVAGGGSVSRFKSKMDDYNQVVADAAFEAKLSADSMGIFGAQAQQVQKKLDAQKQAVQGLQQAILDLNDANRAAMDAESQYQQSIDDATAMVKGHTKALSYSNGELNLGNQKAREAYGVLSQMAASAQDVSTSVLQQTGSQEKANRVLIDAHARLVATAEKMGLNTQEAHKFADALDNIHDPKIQITARSDQAQATIAAAKKALASLPSQKTTALRATAAQLRNEIRDAQAEINALHGKSIIIRSTYVSGVGNVAHEGGGYATGAIHVRGVRRMAEGGFGRPAMMAKGGSNILWGEGPDESYIPHTRNARSRQIASQTVGILGGSVSWGQGAVAAGGNVASGLALGLTGGTKGVTSAATVMAQAAVAAFSQELGIASPSKKFRALGAYTVSGLVQGLTGSTASVKAATKRIASMLYSDFGSSHKGLQQAVARDNSQLLRLASQRDNVASKLKSAQANLASLGKQWSSEKSTIASGIMQNASIITTGADNGRPVNTNDVISQMQDKVKQATQFAAELEQLRKKGLRSDLIQQLATAGVDQAGATALALAGGSSSQIQQMNKLQAGLSSAANATGTAVANSMYGAGIQSARGLIKGLRSQEKAIEAQMLKIAKSMQAAIKKALGIKSPSQVMAELGDYTAQGMAVGINRSTKHAVIAARGMAMAVRQGATITGTSGGGYRGGDVHVHLTVQGSVTSERNLVEAVRTGLLKGGLRNSNTGLVPRR